MTRLLWYIFFVYFASVFEESQQKNGVESFMEDTRTDWERAYAIEHLEYLFITQYNPNPDNVITWDHLHQDTPNEEKLRNLCVLTWNYDLGPSTLPVCNIHRSLYNSEDEPVILKINNGSCYKIDTLRCDCHAKNAEDKIIGDPAEPFWIFPHVSAEYFKLRKMENYHKMDDLIYELPAYE